MSYLANASLETQISYIKQFCKFIIQKEFSGIAVGTITAYAGSTIPQGWLLCDGSAVSRTTYVDLFNKIGTVYGSGDGSTTFSLPDLTSKFIEGSTVVGTIKTAGVPNITGSFNPYGETANYKTYNNTSGVFGQIDSDQPGWGTSSGQDSDNVLINFDASRCSAIYGASSTIQRPALTMKYIIKY